MWTSRIVCESETSFSDIQHTLECLSNKLDAKKIKKLKNIDDIDIILPDRPTIFEDSKFIWGVIKLRTNVKTFDYDISGYEIVQKKKNCSIETSVPFWIKEGEKILLIGTGPKAKSAAPIILSELMFSNSNSIYPVLFDTSRIFDDFKVRRKTFSIGFADRRGGGYSSGVLYGESRETDPMYREAMKAGKKTQAGIYLNWKERGEIAIRFYQNGTMIIHKKIQDMAQMHMPFEIAKTILDQYRLADPL